MSERYHHSHPLEEAPFELVDQFLTASTQLHEGIAELAGAEVAQLRREVSPDQPSPSLQEMYQTPYNPERTIVGIGKVGLFLVNPDMLGDRLQQDALAKIEERDPSYLRAA